MDDGEPEEVTARKEWSGHDVAQAFAAPPGSAVQAQYPSHQHQQQQQQQQHQQQQFPFPMGGPPSWMHPAMLQGWGGGHGPPQSMMYLPMLPMMGGGQPGMMPMGYHPGRDVGNGFGGVGSPGRGGSSDDAQRKRKEREETNHKWMTLDSMAPPEQGTCLLK